MRNKSYKSIKIKEEKMCFPNARHSNNGVHTVHAQTMRRYTVEKVSHVQRVVAVHPSDVLILAEPLRSEVVTAPDRVHRRREVPVVVVRGRVERVRRFPPNLTVILQACRDNKTRKKNVSLLVWFQTVTFSPTVQQPTAVCAQDRGDQTICPGRDFEKCALSFTYLLS